MHEGAAAQDGKFREVAPGVSLEWEDPITMQLRRRGKLLWHKPVKTVLLVKKWQDPEAAEMMAEVASWLMERGVRVLVEQSVKVAEVCATAGNRRPGCARVRLLRSPALFGTQFAGSTVEAWPTAGQHFGANRADLAVVLGGDGTLLHLAKLYSDTPPPPVIRSARESTLKQTVTADRHTHHACVCVCVCV